MSRFSTGRGDRIRCALGLCRRLRAVSGKTFVLPTSPTENPIAAFRRLRRTCGLCVGGPSFDGPHSFAYENKKDTLLGVFLLGGRGWILCVGTILTASGGAQNRSPYSRLWQPPPPARWRGCVGDPSFDGPHLTFSSKAKNRPFGRFFALVGEDGFGPSKLKSNRFTVCPLWPLGNSPIFSFALLDATKRWSWWTDLNPRPADYKSAALPTELHQHF